MPLFRRRALDPARAALLEGFGAVAEPVEAAQRALLTAIPTFRDDGTPLALALAAFLEELAAADRAFSTWSAQAPPSLRARCADALAAARTEADALRLDPHHLAFEALNGRVGDILFHLETFADVEIAIREGTALDRPR